MRAVLSKMTHSWRARLRAGREKWNATDGAEAVPPTAGWRWRALVFVLSSTAGFAATKPNLIVIMADDIGAGELASYGHPTHRTPNMDALGASGVRFETCFTSPVCHP